MKMNEMEFESAMDENYQPTIHDFHHVTLFSKLNVSLYLDLAS